MVVERCRLALCYSCTGL